MYITVFFGHLNSIFVDLQANFTFVHAPINNSAEKDRMEKSQQYLELQRKHVFDSYKSKAIKKCPLHRAPVQNNFIT